MSVLDRRPKPEPSPTPVKKTDQVTITRPEYKGATVDTRYTDHKDLITHVSGSRWVVNYFAQMLGSGDELTHQQMAKDPVYQQYTQIQNLELKVTSPLSGSQRDTGNSFDMTGTATAYPPLIPNTGDVFLADIGDGREGVLSVTSSQRLSMLKESVFEIEYVLVSFATEDYRDDLAKKTVKQTHFIKDLIDHDHDPFVVEEDYQHLLEADKQERLLMNQYFATFFDKTIGTVAVPDQTHLTFDPFLVNGIKQFIDTDSHPLARSIKQYSVELPGRDYPKTFWDVLLGLSMSELPLCHEKLALVDAKCFGQIPQYEGVTYSRVEDVVFPVDRKNDDLSHGLFQSGQVATRDIRHQFNTTRLGSLDQLNRTSNSEVGSVPPIHPVTKDSYYVFSEAFYFHDHERQSELEAITRQVMDGGPVDREATIRLSKDVHRWGSLERFYYTPILLVLLKLMRQGV